MKPQTIQPRLKVNVATWCLITLLTFHGLALRWQAYGDSATWDEVGHFGSGLSHWFFGTFHHYKVNPPLARLIATAPVALSEPQLRQVLEPYEHIGDLEFRTEFRSGTAVANALGERYFPWVGRARSMLIIFSMLGAVVCFLWSRELFGTGAGILAAVLWTSSPTILAYGHLMTPDMTATALGLTACYVFWKWTRRPTWPLALATGTLLGLAQLAKATSIYLFFLLPVVWLCIRWTDRHQIEWKRALREGVKLTVALLLAIWILDLGYGFEETGVRLDRYNFLSRTFGGQHPTYENSYAFRNRFTGTWLGQLRVPVPMNYVLGIDYVKMEYERKYWSFLRGEWRYGGWWYYYLYALTVKETLGIGFLLVLAIGVLLLRRRSYAAAMRDEILLIAPAVIVLAMVSSQTGFNHHIRYILPMFPFVIIWISRVARSFQLRQRGVATAVVLAAVCALISSVRVLPHSMSYFNELAGGPKNGYRHLNNSNVDWGQDLLYLKKWYETNPQARPLFLAYDLPIIDPALAGIQWRPLPVGPHASGADLAPNLDLSGPRPGWHALSVNELHYPDGRFNYFYDLDPVTWVGFTMRVYHISLEQANALRRRYGLAELPSNFESIKTTETVRAQ